MKERNSLMDFNVDTNLKKKDGSYNVRIKLEKEIEDHNTRELAINLAGSIVRNNEKGIYETKLSDALLENLILEKLNKWVPEDTGFKAVDVKVKKLALSRK